MNQPRSNSALDYEAIVRPKPNSTSSHLTYPNNSQPVISDSFTRKDLMLFSLFCKTCQIHLSSSIVAKQHYSGRKHKAAELRNNPQREEPTPETSALEVPAVHRDLNKADLNSPVHHSPSDSILQSVLKKGQNCSSIVDLSVHRTPSGCYYCKFCNLSVNSANQFMQHISSRKHRSRTVMLPAQISKKKKKRKTQTV